MRGVETILFLVVLGTVVAAFAGRLRVPAPSLLVIAGLVVALLPRFPPGGPVQRIRRGEEHHAGNHLYRRNQPQVGAQHLAAPL